MEHIQVHLLAELILNQTKIIPYTMVPISINIELSMALKHTPVALIVQLVPLEANLDKYQLLALNIDLFNM